MADDLEHFINDYCEVLMLKPEFDMEFILFIDNGSCLAIPCSDTLNDQALVRQIRVFYNLLRAQGGLFEFFGTKSSLRVDVVQIVWTKRAIVDQGAAEVSVLVACQSAQQHWSCILSTLLSHVRPRS